MSISMLNENIPILVRETLQDRGTESCQSISPDSIARKTKFHEDELSDIFARTYDRDISVEGTHPNCFVTVVTREEKPDYSDINCYNKYIQWVNKKNVAARNVCVISGQSPISTNTVVVDNPDRQWERRMWLIVEIEGETPSGVSYGIRQPEFGIDEKRTYIKGDSRTDTIVCRFLMPPDAQRRFEIWFEAGRIGGPTSRIRMMMTMTTIKRPTSA